MRAIPAHCPVCAGNLVVTQLHCQSCGTDVTGEFSLGRLSSLREPHASLIELFLRVRGNVKEMERELGLSYPTVRARLDEAFAAAGLERDEEREARSAELEGNRLRILESLDRGEISVEEARNQLLELKNRRST